MATLSMRAFLYDALLTFGDKYKGYILSDIKEKYKKMLNAGATSFWETEKGATVFDGAGSLCHGWSALPIYYLNKIIPNISTATALMVLKGIYSLYEVYKKIVSFRKEQVDKLIFQYFIERG